MVTKDVWRVEAPELIRAELERRLPGETRIISVEPDSFYHEGREVRYVTVLFKGASPYDDSRRLTKIEFDIRDMLWERGYDPVPSMDFLEEGTSLV